MNFLKFFLAVILFFSTNVWAEPASDSSIRQLLDITQSRKIVDGIAAQFDSLMDNTAQQALAGKTPTAKQKQAIFNMKNRMVSVMKGELAWEKLEPMYLRIYSEAFSEEEVAGTLSFYKTPVGQAVIVKMPVLMQQTMVEVQRMLEGATPKMQKIQQDFVAEMESLGE